MPEDTMTTPLTITSRDQGSNIAQRHDSDEGYWANFREPAPAAQWDAKRWSGMKVVWQLWSLTRPSRQG
jgi:hypothetical protein